MASNLQELSSKNELIKRETVGTEGIATGQEISLLCIIKPDVTGNKVQEVTGFQDLEEHDSSLQPMNENVNLILYKTQWFWL